MREGKIQMGLRRKTSVQETKKLIKSSQAMNFPWRTVEKTPGKEDEDLGRVSGTGL